MIDTSEYSNPPAQPIEGIQQRIDELVRLTTGLGVRETDLDRLARWATERVRALALPGAGSRGIESYGLLLAEDSVAGHCERELVTAQFTTGESYFFRDQGQFDLLAATILPELIERRAAQHSLRLWSAGCATGEEAYSLAMLVDELAPRVDGWNILILGTDINHEAIRKARKGSYSQWSFRALDAARTQHYFHERGGEWRIDRRLRAMVTFRQGDLLHDRSPDPEPDLHDMDLILCRNVFIYLAPQAVAQIATKFADTLADGGTLMTGHTELMGHPTGRLRTRVYPGSVVFQKTDGAAPEAVLAAPQPQWREPNARESNAVARHADPFAKDKRAFEQHRVPARLLSTPPAAPAAPTPSSAAAPAAPLADRLEALLQTAWREANRGACDAAEATCRKATALAAFDPRPYYLLAQLALERGNTEESRTMLKKVIYLDPSFIAANLDLGALYDRDGDAARARRMHQNAQRELKKLPPQTAVRLYGESTAGEILQYVERLLAQPAEQAGAAASRSSRRTHG